jgi:hypothetical protein
MVALLTSDRTSYVACFQICDFPCTYDCNSGADFADNFFLQLILAKERQSNVSACNIVTKATKQAQWDPKPCWACLRF